MQFRLPYRYQYKVLDTAMAVYTLAVACTLPIECRLAIRPSRQLENTRHDPRFQQSTALERLLYGHLLVSLEKHKVFLDGHRYIPSARHASWECHKISFSKRSRGSIIGWRNCHLSLQEVARFVGVVGPWKLRDIASPGSPREHAFLLQETITRLRNYLDDGSS